MADKIEMRSLRRQDNNSNAEVELPQLTSLKLQKEALIKDTQTWIIFRCTYSRH
ncbi:MAG: hypothetical protein V7K25_26075 [Nostoc sp.]|uniref:hypothetical protein n=1 Tax=Nostoc sp. TaxID=1180 RepID=UPI002FFA8194